MVEGSKQVRVDNWGIFFLQRLQMFFSKTDYCDLTLQFEGNVQLKVHRLVMNACTEYFAYLEQSCPTLEENTIMMPPDLQADVIVPIVNFMYTGMLEFHMSIFEKLYQAANLMNITVLTKLLDAQKAPLQPLKSSKKKTEIPHTWNLQGKKVTAKTSNTSDLPPTLPGRKLPVWKRKTVPTIPMQHPSSQLHFPEKWSMDPLSVPDNTPKPTRFEWPDEDLPTLNLMDTSFEEISYTSKPLLTQEEEVRASTSFDDVKNNINVQTKKSGGKASSGNINIKEVEDYVKEQRIRSDISCFEEGDEEYEIGQKRKLDQTGSNLSPKRLKVNDKENKETTISIKGSNGTELDHTKFVSQILKRYPQLLKKNKNIRLKIMAPGTKHLPEQRVHSTVKTPKLKVQVDSSTSGKIKPQKLSPESKSEKPKFSDEGPWSCDKCSESGEASQEFVLYYLYRKHMTDVHNEVFDSRLCKYCGRRCAKHNLMMYHLYTKHGLKPPSSYNFPKCDQCPHIALSPTKLSQHKQQHDPSEMQCSDCKLAFTSQQTLTAHIQITGHFNKSGKSSYDCQYCTKKLQSAINLFSHIKNSHLKEARRDGIVSLDETDDLEYVDDEEEDEDQEETEEYIVPELLPETTIHKDKVKIISNVKVPIKDDQGTENHEQTVPLEPSSEAEALSNVASGIATSLGLVDIVVLDENQQYILQQQENQSQPEYILPELTSNENPFSGQVITTQHSSVIPQGMLHSSGSDIGSTDELVMVLTDHDYQDEQEGGATDNSNIVVLYSHPVDGQQGQFITSQGNLLVNSQTGMLEIRNGAAVSSTTNQITNPEEAPIESIEMIQREIESHNGVKQEQYYEEERKPVITEMRQQTPINESLHEPSQNELVQSEVIVQNTEHHDEIVENVEHQESFQSDSLEEDRIHADNEEGIEKKGFVENSSCLEQEIEDKGETNKNEDNVDTVVETFEEPMEIEMSDASHKDMENTNDEQQSNLTQMTPSEEPPQTHPEPMENDQPPALEQEVTSLEKPEPEISEEENAVDIPPEIIKNSESISPTVCSENIVFNDFSKIDYVCESSVNNENKNSNQKREIEVMEIDGKRDENQQEMRDTEVKESDASDQGKSSRESDKTKEDQIKEGNEMSVEQGVGQEEVSESTSEYHQQSETSNSQYNDEDENSQSSQDTSQSQDNGQSPNKNHSNINQTILEDWEDTDSQQSEKQRAALKAAENVNKLMDDWEEEEEDDKKD